MGCPTNSLKSLQLIQNAASRVLMRNKRRDHISQVKFRIQFKILLFTNKVLNNRAPSYLKDLIVGYFPNRALCSQTAGLLVVPRVSKSRMGGRAFSYQALLCGTSCQFGFRKQTPSLPLRLGLKLSVSLHVCLTLSSLTCVSLSQQVSLAWCYAPGALAEIKLIFYCKDRLHLWNSLNPILLLHNNCCC